MRHLHRRPSGQDENIDNSREMVERLNRMLICWTNNHDPGMVWMGSSCATRTGGCGSFTNICNLLHHLMPSLDERMTLSENRVQGNRKSGLMGSGVETWQFLIRDSTRWRKPREQLLHRSLGQVRQPLTLHKPVKNFCRNRRSSVVTIEERSRRNYFLG